MANLFDFLIALFGKKKNTKDGSVIVKNYISGNNNQNNSNKVNANKTSSNPPSSYPANKKEASANGNQSVVLQSIRLYSTGSKGKVYTNKFYKAINHNFGIEVILSNNSSVPRSVNLGHCIYSENGSPIIKGNFHPKIAAHSKLTENIYVEAKTFDKLKVGKYKSQFWVDDKRVQKAYFYISNR